MTYLGQRRRSGLFQAWCVGAACSCPARMRARVPSHPFEGNFEGSNDACVIRRSCCIRPEGCKLPGRKARGNGLRSPPCLSVGQTSPYVTRQFRAQNTSFWFLHKKGNAYMSGARCAEYSQWKINNVLAESCPPNKSFTSASLSQKLSAPSIWPPSYSYSKRQSMITRRS